MTSLWLDRARDIDAAGIDTDDFEPDADYDVVIAGAGLTGLVTALLFARAGLSVCVLEARFVGAAATGNTTGKLSLLQGSHLSGIVRHTAKKNAQAYVEGNREGMEWLLRYCAEHGVPVQRRDAVSYAGTPAGRARVEEEYQAGRMLGLDVTRDPLLDVPFAAHGAVRLANQAQFDPMDVLAALAADIRRHGGRIVEGARVQGVRASNPAVVRTSLGTVRGRRVVLATGTPMLDRGLYFLKEEALRSYVLAFRVPGELPRDMYLSVDRPTRSVRTAPDGDGELLLVGGEGHRVGRELSPLARVNALTWWAQHTFPGAERTHAWSAQDYSSASGVPFVGWLPRGRGRVFFASGYDKWGMTNAVAASLTLAADVLGGHLPWAQTLGRRMTTARDVGTFLGANAATAVAAARGYLGAYIYPKPQVPPREGAGYVTHDGLRPVGVSTVDGYTCGVSAMCPHLGGLVTWNDAEHSWDCPLHGSRFEASGEALEGPAVRGLRAS